jgi:hypothetical protein
MANFCWRNHLTVPPLHLRGDEGKEKGKFVFSFFPLLYSASSFPLWLLLLLCVFALEDRTL